MKRKAWVAALLSICLLLAGCGAPTEPVAPLETPSVETAAPMMSAKNFVLPIYAEQSMHPISGAGTTNLTLAPLLYEGLFAVDGAGVAQGLLCAEYTVDETFQNWRFTLKEGVRFSDGTALTAAEVVSSLQLSQTAGSAYSTRLAGAMVFADREQVCIRLAAPRSGLPALLDIPIVSGGGQRPAGTGPYALVEQENGLRLALRPDWHGTATLPLEQIGLRPLQEYGDLMAAFDAGNISLIDTDLTAANTLGFSGGYEAKDYVTSQMVYLGMNLRSGALREQALRTAVAMAVDRETICQVELARHAVAAAWPVMPGSAVEPQLPQPEWTAEELAAFLAEAGYETDEAGLLLRANRPVELTLVGNNENPYQMAIGLAVAAQLERLGMTVTAEMLSFDDYRLALEKGQFDLYIGQVKLPPDGDLSALVSGALNYGAYQSVAAGERLAAYLAAPEAEREVALALLCEQLGEDVPFVTIGFKCRSVLFLWGEIGGLAPVAGNVFYSLEQWRFSG